jgi:hypothetical protein
VAGATAIDDDMGTGPLPPKHPEIALLLAPAPRRIHRAFRAPALVLSLLGLALLLVPGALAHGTHPQKSACPATTVHHAHGTIAGRCVKHATHKAKHKSKHKSPAKKPSHSPSKKSTAMTPATCEDGSLPVRAKAGAQFSCSDGSEPACEDGSAPTRSSAGAVPLCPVLKDSGSEEGSEACEKGAEEGECPAAGCEEASEACQAEASEEPET